MAANREVVEKAYAAFGKGDIPALLDLLDDGVEWFVAEDPAAGRFVPRQGRSRSFFAAVGAAWDPLEVEIEVIDDLGDDFVVGVVHCRARYEAGMSWLRRRARLHRAGQQDHEVPGRQLTRRG